MRVERHALVTAIACLVLMVIGSLVHGTGSSLACPDWPLCRGSLFPAMKDGVEYEHTHRLTAALVAGLVVWLFVRTRRLADPVPGRLTALACALLAVQATLGGVTVVYRLPATISIAHLAASMILLVVLVLVSVRVALRQSPFIARVARPWFGLAALVVFVQIVLGGVVRHSGAALACGRIPLCGGKLLPDDALGRLHMVHRLGGVVAALAVIAVCFAAYWRNASRSHAVFFFAPAVIALAQVALGVAVVLGAARLDLVTAHHATGALLLASLAMNWGLAPSDGSARGMPLPHEHSAREHLQVRSFPPVT